jgi:hypothetical protein
VQGSASVSINEGHRVNGAIRNSAPKALCARPALPAEGDPGGGSSVHAAHQMVP